MNLRCVEETLSQFTVVPMEDETPFSEYQAVSQDWTQF